MKKFFKCLLSITVCCAMLMFSFWAVPRDVGVAQSYSSPTDWTGKKVLILGDSIQWGFGKYAETASNKLGAKIVTNVALRGSVYNKQTKSNRIKKSIYNQVNNVKKLGYYDYYIIAAGTNDSHYSEPLGKIKSQNVSEVNGAINYTITKINKAYKKVHKTGHPKIIIITPIGRVKPKCENLNVYRDDIAAVASRYSYVTVIDGYKLATKTEMSKKENSEDGLHPTPNFAKNKIALRFIKQLKLNLK